MANTLRQVICGIITVMLATPSVAWSAEPASPVSLQAPPLLLNECFALALKRSEEIAIRQELLKETEGHFLQALSTALPHASFDLSEKRQDGSGGSAFTLKEIPERKFVFSQPLFSGFKEFAAIAASRAERRQRLHEKARAEQLLFVDVADAFHLLLEQREDLAALEKIRQTLIERIDELKAREQLGRSRPSEVVSAEAQLRKVEAEIELVRSQEITAHQLLEFLTGLPRIEGIVDDGFTLPPLDAEAAYLAKADARPDVKAAEEIWRIATKQVTIARSKLWPSVGLQGDYYTKRVGVSSSVDWDILLTVDVPIFQGGEDFGAITAASSQARQAKLRFAQLQRQAALDIHNAYATLTADLARTTALEKALEAAEENYRLQAQDYRFNLVNNLEVLQAIQALEDARRDLIRARHDAKRAYWRLLVATGELG